MGIKKKDLSEPSTTLPASTVCGASKGADSNEGGNETANEESSDWAFFGMGHGRNTALVFTDDTSAGEPKTKGAGVKFEGGVDA